MLVTVPLMEEGPLELIQCNNPDKEKYKPRHKGRIVCVRFNLRIRCLEWIGKE